MGRAEDKLVERANFCKDRCPVCTRARKGNRIAKIFVKYIDRKICSNCRAYERLYGKKAYE